MAISSDVTDGQSESGKGYTHTEKVAKQHPEAVKAVADRMGGEEAHFLRRVLDDVSE